MLIEVEQLEVTINKARRALAAIEKFKNEVKTLQPVAPLKSQPAEVNFSADLYERLTSRQRHELRQKLCNVWSA